MKRLTPEQIRVIYDQGPDAVVALITQLFDVIERLEARVTELERQVQRNSRNSSQPPSADGLKKPPPRSQRRPSGRRPGGQPGHPGETLKQVAHPDVIQRHPAGQCAACGRGLHQIPLDRLIRRQVFDIPPLVLQVTEHQVEVKTCPDCAHVTLGTWPTHVEAPVQYGPQLLGLATYLQTFQMIPVDRVRAMFAELWGQAPSGRTLLDAVRRAADIVQPTLDTIRAHLRQAPVVNADETGLRVESHLWWMHTVTAPGWTLFGLHRQRGQVAMRAMGVLAERQGVVVHDFWKPYYRLAGVHALCNAHLLRDLTRVIETTQDAWAKRLQTLLVDMHRATEAAREAGQTAIAPQARTSYRALYDLYVGQGRISHPDPVPGRDQHGRPKRTFPQNLLRRLETRPDEILAFFYDLQIPFDNNAAERALRMIKVKQKISGTFRTEDGGRQFAALRSYIVTAVQQGLRPLAVLRNALAGKAWMPE